ncbi:hypothetical protein BDA99DRAFT_285448 [Phascolomyces articulosus]|uniref:Uncharacterized protein n=1 Tax=Phascolomyces articulosus TaxID=60185 RepID=A0AAD5JMT4_9FUNG|nr:hypothetical protein BDA99DRAFT_285448 [Phascolomyces articulosus]
MNNRKSVQSGDNSSIANDLPPSSILVDHEDTEALLLQFPWEQFELDGDLGPSPNTPSLTEGMSSFTTGITGESSISQVSMSNFHQHSRTSSTIQSSDDFSITSSIKKSFYNGWTNQLNHKMVRTIMKIPCRETQRKGSVSGTIDSTRQLSKRTYECFVDNCPKNTYSSKGDLWRHVYGEHLGYRPITLDCYICEKQIYEHRKDAAEAHVIKCYKRRESIVKKLRISDVPEEKYKLTDDSGNAIHFCNFEKCSTMTFGKEDMKHHVFECHDHINNGPLQFTCRYCGESKKLSRKQFILKHENRCRQMHLSRATQRGQAATGDSSSQDK